MGINPKGFGIYLPLGYPSPEIFSKYIGSISGLVDLIEIGIPTERPIYDGPVIRRAHREIMSRGYNRISIESYQELLRVSCDKVALAYYSEISGDLGGFLDKISGMGFRCLLAPDLLIEYPERLGEYLRASRDHGLDPCFFISSKFPYSLVKRLPDYGAYLVYLGIQASTGTSLPIQVIRNISIARDLIGDRSRLAVGFGINSLERVLAVLRGGADIAIIGTEVIKRLAIGFEEALTFVRSISEGLRGGASG
jgi:tryptophan synthase alpha chain